MPKSSRARTRAARTRQAATGECYTSALAATTFAWAGMMRDCPPGPGTTEIIFMDVMIAGKRAAQAAPPGDLPAAIAAVRKAVNPMWATVIPEAARDVLIACAEVAADNGITSVPNGAGTDMIADTMLEMTASWIADGRPSGRFTPAAAYASSAAFDRDDDKATFAAVCLLLALAHPATATITGDEWGDDGWGDSDPDEGGRCFECGADPNSPYCCVD